ncbi:MAG: CDP-diacylglycerol--serine O-phosphatidyltransferase [Bacteroidales bacterium]|nr:CDP-diacylglycerol--serine O-phosphatidyltransferase [Bacteroidales bacterium]
MKKHIPNIITSMNLLCGSCAVILSLWGYLYPAFYFILAAAVFDFLDGFFARILNAYSNIGKELDSLADIVSFGLAPSVMFFVWYYRIENSLNILAFVPLIIVVFSALRLAIFNTDTRQTKDFLGLPTPANAMIIGSLTCYGQICQISKYDSIVVNLLNSNWFIPVVSIILALLLVSNIPMFSIKKKKLNFKENWIVSVFLIGSALIIILGELFFPHKPIFEGNYSLWILLIFIYYILLNLIRFIITSGRKVSDPDRQNA